jgi:hypothetical protein
VQRASLALYSEDSESLLLRQLSQQQLNQEKAHSVDFEI